MGWVWQWGFRDVKGGSTVNKARRIVVVVHNVEESPVRTEGF